MKKIRLLLIILVSLGLAYAIFVYSLIYSEANATPAKGADTLIVLGAKVNGDPAKPSPVLLERLTTALTYLEANPKTKVVVSGGQGADESQSEASVMSDYFIAQGIERNRIIREDDSTRTMENLMNTKEKIGLGQTVIVSNDFHMYRALMLARRIGIENAEGLAAPSKTSAKFATYVREVAALGYGMIFDW